MCLKKLFNMKIFLIGCSIFLVFFPVNREGLNKELPDDPLRIAIAGLSHDHAHWIFGREDRGDIEIVGIYESDEVLRQRYADRYNLQEDLFFNDLENILDVTEPEAVAAFGPTYEHLRLVEVSAPRKIDVMVEKPLAVNLDHALKMKDLVEEHDIHLITNYETTWYASNQAVYEMIHAENRFEEIRKMVVHDSHQGPKEIGVSDEFFDWLTDPELNGGGALMDFGCYGANLMTWMMQGEEPVSVTAVTQNMNPDIYPEVDDEATIVVTYHRAQGIIQASWNWPYNRKDMHIYGMDGYVYALNSTDLEILPGDGEPKKELTLSPLEYPKNDPFSYFAGVIRGRIELKETDLSSLSNNVTVMKILDAAKESARTGRTVYLN